MKWIDLPPVWLAGCLVLAWAQSRYLPVPVFGGLGAAAGSVLVAAGIALMALAALEMARRRTTIIPRQAPSALVTSGIFRLTRNPIYLGDLLILAGAALLWGSLLGLALVPVLGTLLARRFIAGEEARLAAAFGAEFEAYAARVRRWL